jgi:hypothetical protein
MHASEPPEFLVIIRYPSAVSSTMAVAKYDGPTWHAGQSRNLCQRDKKRTGRSVRFELLTPAGGAVC